MLKTRVKVFVIMLITIFGLIGQTSARADLATDLLQQIADNTKQLLLDFEAFAEAWLQGDTSDQSPTAKLQGYLSDYMNEVWNLTDQQIGLQPALLDYYFGGKAPIYANDITFPTMLGHAYIQGKSQDELDQSVLNYTYYAAALNMKHIQPSQGWAGTQTNKDNYENFYKTISAVQSFNAYIVSQFVANYKDKFALSDLQNKLKSEASSPDWFEQVAGEDIGLVLRQNLMFTSQIYLLLMQMLETQNYLLASSAMSTSLIVLGNQFNENILLNKAIGKIS